MYAPLIVLIGNSLLLDGISAYLATDKSVRIQRVMAGASMSELRNRCDIALIIVDRSITATADIFSALPGTDEWCLLCLDPAQNRGSIVRSQRVTGLSMEELCSFALHTACCADVTPAGVGVAIDATRQTLSIA